MRNLCLICQCTSCSSTIGVQTCCNHIFFSFASAIRSALKHAHKAASWRTQLSDLNLYDSFCKISILITFTGTIFLARRLRSLLGQQATRSHRNQSPLFLFPLFSFLIWQHTLYIAFKSCFYIWPRVLSWAGTQWSTQRPFNCIQSSLCSTTDLDIRSTCSRRADGLCKHDADCMTLFRCWTLDRKMQENADGC